MILPALIGVAEKHLNLPEEQIAHLRKEKVGFWNPCSHASSHTMALHFYQFQNEKPGRAGAFFRESEPDLYTTAADYLLETSAILGSMLDEATGFLCSE
jgi:hypothetical protein